MEEAAEVERNHEGGARPTEWHPSAEGRFFGTDLEWTFTGTSGDGPTARDEVPGEEGAARREVNGSG